LGRGRSQHRGIKPDKGRGQGRSSPPPSDVLKSSLQNSPRNKDCQKILREYECAGATRQITPQEAKHFVPYFIISKKEGEKTKERLISDCRQLNLHFTPQKFRLEHMGNIFPYLRKGWFCGKIDLKDAYFHLKLHSSLEKHVCMQVGGETWQFQAACFGISSLPQKFMTLMRVWERKWRKEGKVVFIYLDDILLLAPSKKTAAQHLAEVKTDLLLAGFRLNLPKSCLEPTQEIKHLGQWINLKKGQLEIPQEKLKSLRKELGKVLTAQKMSCRKLSSIVGQVRSYLVSMPFLRILTDQLCKMVDLHTKWG
jgi:tRNA nucleotidyltransferase/poly(A) polymerase